MSEYTTGQARNLLDWMNRMILLPDKPSVGDYICLDHDDHSPSDFCKGEQGISWYTSKVIDVDQDRYRVSYDDGRRWYAFADFDVPFYSKRGTKELIYPALPLPKGDKFREKSS